MVSWEIQFVCVKKHFLLMVFKQTMFDSWRVNQVKASSTEILGLYLYRMESLNYCTEDTNKNGYGSKDVASKLQLNMVQYSERANLCGSISTWLVVWNMIFMIFQIFGIIIPTDELHHFSEG